MKNGHKSFFYWYFAEKMLLHPRHHSVLYIFSGFKHSNAYGFVLVFLSYNTECSVFPWQTFKLMKVIPTVTDKVVWNYKESTHSIFDLWEFQSTLCVEFVVLFPFRFIWLT